MELSSILQFLGNKSILVTGATGFLAKIFIEKILRVQPHVKKLKILVHVSTAFVSGEREGLILESSYKNGETLNGTDGLDIDAEKRLVEETLEQLIIHKTPSNQP